jgi:hypothetical protein
VLEVIDDYAFASCHSLIAAYFPKSLQRIGNMAFSRCYSLISAELPPTVQVDDETFIGCPTLEMRQPQIDHDSLTYEQMVQRSRESITWLKVRSDGLPIHKICSDPNSALDQLQSTININNNNNNPLQQTDELGMTALHLLCLNPNATPEMCKLLVNACPYTATTHAQMVTNVEYVGFANAVEETRGMVTPIKLWLKVKGISYDDNDFDEEGHMTLHSVFQKGLENDINLIMSISNHVYPCMQAATINGMNLEMLYHLAMYDPKLIYELSFETKAPTSKKARNV